MKIIEVKKPIEQEMISSLYILYKEFFLEQKTINSRYGLDLNENEFSSQLEAMVGTERDLLFIAIEENIIIGFAKGYKKEKFDFFLQDFYIAPQFRKKRHGTKFFEQVQETLKEMNFESIDLLVDVNNDTGKTFWKSLGFNTWQLKMNKIIS